MRVCLHYPGETYDGKVATYTVTGARLAEVSLVPAGSAILIRSYWRVQRSEVDLRVREHSKTEISKKT